MPSLSGGDRGHQLRHPSEVLSDRRKRKLVLCAARTSKPKPTEPQDTFQMREPHLDAFAFAARLLEGLSAGERPSDVAGTLINTARDLADWCVRTALGF